jgi:hypothetical protein
VSTDHGSISVAKRRAAPSWLVLAVALGCALAGLSLVLAVGFWWWLLASWQPGWFELVFGVLHWGDLTAASAIVLGVAGALVLRRARRGQERRRSKLLLAASLVGWLGAGAMAAAYLTPIVLLFLGGAPD